MAYSIEYSVRYSGHFCSSSSDSHMTCTWCTYSCVHSLPTDQVSIRGEGIRDESRVYFIDSSRKLNNQLLDTDAPSVNFRGLMDPVSEESLVN